MRRAAAIVLFALLALTLSLVARYPGADGASGEAQAVPHFVPELGLPATEVVAFGASPGEAPTEAWAYGYLGEVPPAGEPEQIQRYTLLEHGADGAWQRIPLPVGAAGEVAKRPDTFPSKLGALAGQSTPAGSVGLLTDPGIVLRDPAGVPRLVPPPSGAGLLGEGESVPPQAPPEGAPTPYAVYDPAPGQAGLLISPYGDAATQGEAPGAVGPGVLDYDGAEWTREPVEAQGEPVRPLAISCGPTTTAPVLDSGENCWLLAGVGQGFGRLALFRRGPASTGGGGGEPEGGGEGTAGVSWTPVSVEGGLLGGQADAPAGNEPGGASLAALPGNAQMLTTTSQGVWVDFQETVSGGEPRSASELVEPTGSGGTAAHLESAAKVVGSWCYPTGLGCEASLGAPFPAAYRSFAWPGTASEEPGRRVVTGLPGRATLELGRGGFHEVPGAGGSPGIAPGGAAFAMPEFGFLADGVNPDAAPDGAGQSQVIAVTVEPPAAQTALEPLPFRRPLNAVAGDPDGSGKAIAVGAGGEFARFEPGSGWHQDSVDEVNSEEGTANFGIHGNLGESLLGVAWPAPERAYAVGAEGGLWMWTTATESWEPLFHTAGAPFNGVAFSASDPSRGFVVGSPNVLRLNQPDRWGPDVGRAPIPVAPETPPVFTSVAFAGEEAITTWHEVNAETGVPSGGVSVEDGSGWKVEPAVEDLVAGLPGRTRWPTKVAALPDGGAVVAGPGFVIKRESASASWQFSAEPLPEAGNIAALGAYRDASGVLRGVVSIDLGPRREVVPTQYSGTQEPLPASGYLLRETADGWSDVEHAALPVEEGSVAMPERPEPVLGLAVSPDGESILGVGGQTGTFNTSTEPTVTGYETAAATRLPASDAVEPDETVPVAPPPSRPTIAIGGQAACTAPCADQAADEFAPDALLPHALGAARELAATDQGALRAFLYTGGRLESGAGPPAYESELSRLARLFSTAAPLQLLTAPSADLLAGGAPLFTTAFSEFGPTAGGAPYYALRSEPAGGQPLEVLVLDLSTGVLGSVQESWLREGLAAARSEGVPTVVVGNASPGFTLPDPPAGVGAPVQVQDPAALASILVEGGAAAYFFDYPGAEVLSSLQDGAQGILAIGTGTLGYGKPGAGAGDWLGSSAFLLAEVEASSLSGQGAGVLVRAIPNIESLTLHGRNGPRLAAGEAEIFEALGRLPAGGIRVDQAEGASVFSGPEPYVTLPFPNQSLTCEGVNCPFAAQFEYGFSSSDPEVGDFVTPSGGLNSEGHRPTDPRSGFFCAKAPGTTTISITTGGLSYSEPIEVTEGESGEGCRLPEPAPPPGIPPAPVETQVSQPMPAKPASPHPHHPPAQHGGVTPSPAPTHAHPAPTPAPPAPHPSAPAATPTPVGPVPQAAVNPVVSPHPPPGVEPAPPTGISPASQPVTQGAPQPGAQPVGQVGNAPAPVIAPAPGISPGRAPEAEAAIQRQHLAVRVQAGPGSASLPTAALILGSAVLLALAAGVGVSAGARGPRRASGAVALGSAARRPTAPPDG
jgi:hypothetical protein